jgi:putative ABC transport system permease protein
MMQEDPLIDVSSSHILFAAAPLAVLAWLSSKLDLDLESPILMGTIRTFVQLTILSYILDPIFVRGVELWWLVLAYALFMVLLAAFESSSRGNYHFEGMFWGVLATLLANVTWVSIVAFGIILHPKPVWDPHYVIPIVGMLLGNCINGISLSLNSMLTSMVESSREVELLLSFGATSYEASSRLLKESVRTGTMPQLNGMAIIGLISIPGMMTGQILGGTSVTQAARYQILIIYLIAACSFGTVLTQIFLVLRVCFDSRSILRTDRIRKRAKTPSVIELIRTWCDSFVRCFTSSRRRRLSSSFSIPFEESTYLAPQGELHVKNVPQSSQTGRSGENPVISISALSYSFEIESNDGAAIVEEEVLGMRPFDRRVLFQNVSFQLRTGGTAFVNGPSGVGKSTLMRILAGLTSSEVGTVLLFEKSLLSYKDMTVWRKQVLYVPQTKVDIPGTPYDLMKKVASFQVWKKDNMTSPSYSDMKVAIRELIQSWGMNKSLLDSEWKALSGGESQRMLLALALASRPKVILLDESTSALDLESKVRVEKSVESHCAQFGMCAIWITHDQSQKDRIRME